MTFSEIALYICAVWILIGALVTLFLIITERQHHQDKYLVNDPIDFLISIALWPIVIFALIGFLKPPDIKPPKKKPKIIVSEDNETEEAFANRCKRL